VHIGERILKIGQHLVELQRKNQWTTFWLKVHMTMITMVIITMTTMKACHWMC